MVKVKEYDITGKVIDLKSEVPIDLESGLQATRIILQPENRPTKIIHFYGPRGDLKVDDEIAFFQHGSIPGIVCQEIYGSNGRKIYEATAVPTKQVGAAAHQELF